MKALLVSANTEKINILPLPLGLNYVAAAARNSGHDVKVLDLLTESDSQNKINEALLSFRPNIIGISVRNIDDQYMQKPKFMLDEVRLIIHNCRRLSKAPIVLGGAGYSIFPERALDYLEADMGIQGEGEIAFPELLNRIEGNKDLAGIQGLYLRGSGLQGERKFMSNLDALPVSGAHTFWDSKDLRLWMPFQTRRGCPMNCSYCSTSAIEGFSIRKRSPEMVVSEITLLLEAGFRRFYFVDSIFNFPLLYAKKICRKMIEKGLNMAWRAIIYPHKIDEELIDLMARAGCQEVSLGFESGCEKILHNMNKKFTPREVQAVAAAFARHGIRQTGFLMLGGPGETRESVADSLYFADSLPLNGVKVTLGIRIYPHTDLAKIALSEGKISPRDDLLYPKFYMAELIEDWLKETVNSWISKRSHWLS